MFHALGAKRVSVTMCNILLLLFVISIYSSTQDSVSAEPVIESKLVLAALQRVGKTTLYDASYQNISFPMGDVADDRGVCTDVIIRSYRKLGIDLQELVHIDMLNNFSEYPNIWGLNKPDSNIDHRRVPNLRRYFERHAMSLTIGDDPDNYKTGDVVSWMLSHNAPHIGIVVSQKSSDGVRPLIVHNIGGGTLVDDYLFASKITGHYRYSFK